MNKMEKITQSFEDMVRTAEYHLEEKELEDRVRAVAGSRLTKKESELYGESHRFYANVRSYVNEKAKKAVINIRSTMDNEYGNASYRDNISYLSVMEKDEQGKDIFGIERNVLKESHAGNENHSSRELGLTGRNLYVEEIFEDGTGFKYIIKGESDEIPVSFSGANGFIGGTFFGVQEAEEKIYKF